MNNHRYDVWYHMRFTRFVFRATPFFFLAWSVEQYFPPKSLPIDWIAIIQILFWYIILGATLGVAGIANYKENKHAKNND